MPPTPTAPAADWIMPCPRCQVGRLMMDDPADKTAALIAVCTDRRCSSVHPVARRP